MNDEENLILKKIAKLIDLKSILTLSLGITFCILTFKGLFSSDNFLNVFLMVITFYFSKSEISSITEQKK